MAIIAFCLSSMGCLLFALAAFQQIMLLTCRPGLLR